MDSTTGPWKSNVTGINKVLKDDFLRNDREVSAFEGPEPRPLRVEGRPAVNKPLVKLALDDIRNVEIDIEKNIISGDGRWFVGLRFWTTGVASLANEPSPIVSEPESVQPDAGSQEPGPSTSQKTKGSPGRKPLYDWTAIYDAVLEKLLDDAWPTIDHGEDDWKTDEDLIRFIQAFSFDKWHRNPGKSTVQPHIPKIRKMYEEISKTL